jgi:hypothetical protein
MKANSMQNPMPKLASKGGLLRCFDQIAMRVNLSPARTIGMVARTVK